MVASKRKPRISRTDFISYDEGLIRDYGLEDCIRCVNCGMLSLLTFTEYLEGAWKKRYWSCGQCGQAIDPYNQRE